MGTEAPRELLVPVRPARGQPRAGGVDQEGDLRSALAAGAVGWWVEGEGVCFPFFLFFFFFELRIC